MQGLWQGSMLSSDMVRGAQQVLFVCFGETTPWRFSKPRPSFTAAVCDVNEPRRLSRLVKAAGFALGQALQ